MTAFLPQQDPHPEKRQHRLATTRKHYQWNHTHVSPLAMVEHVPFHDQFSWHWLVQVGERALVELANHVELEGDPFHRDFHKSKHSLLSKIVRASTADAKGLLHLVRDSLRFHGRSNALHARPQSLDDYAGLFREIGLPPVSRYYQDDWHFANMRVAGPNPMMIERVSQLDERFPVTEQDYCRALPDDSLEAAAKEGRLYLADYRLLEAVESGHYPEAQKYVYAPLALFAVDKTQRKLMPVAIQCRQQPGPDNPIFTPGDGYNWLIAKTIVEIADANIHEPVMHLARTHLFVEPFVVATYRQLAAEHPLSLMLLPHFEGTLIINSEAWAHLIANHGACDKLMAGTIQSTRRLAVSSAQSFRWYESTLPATLASRGVDDPELLPDYPYRDDALLYWRAIERWVADYVALYYPTDADVAADSELAAWCADLISQDGGRVVGLGQNGAINGVAELQHVLTVIVFICSVQHAAVNFPQFDLMSYCPNVPLAGYAPAPTEKTGATEQDYLDMLPPLDMAELQMNLGHLLGTVHYTRLGHYHWHHFHDKRVAPFLKRFDQEIQDIGETIAERNENRHPYEYLMPDGIPQSINI